MHETGEFRDTKKHNLNENRIWIWTVRKNIWLCYYVHFTSQHFLTQQHCSGLHCSSFTFLTLRKQHLEKLENDDFSNFHSIFRICMSMCVGEIAVHDEKSFRREVICVPLYPISKPQCLKITKNILIWIFMPKISPLEF